jgi:PadR family transcriptional regulator PadR
MCSSMSPQGTEDDEGFRPFFHGKPLRGLLPIAVLGLINDKPAHGGDIYQRLREKFDIETPRPVVYVLLRKLERGGLMVSTWDIQESGPAKRRYTITEDGLEYLNLGVETLKNFSKIIKHLTTGKA